MLPPSPLRPADSLTLSSSPPTPFRLSLLRSDGLENVAFHPEEQLYLRSPSHLSLKDNPLHGQLSYIERENIRIGLLVYIFWQYFQGISLSIKVLICYAIM